MAQDPERADTILSDAMPQAQETLAELRQLSRGIAPPVLVDRGLEAAIEEVALRSPIPTTVYASLSEVSAHVGQATYFVVAESLANTTNTPAPHPSTSWLRCKTRSCTPPSPMTDGVDRVAEGGLVLDPEVVSHVMGRGRRDDPLAGLTPRENEVPGLMAEGHTNSGIAARLVTTEGAVEKHSQRIFAKLGLVAGPSRSSSRQSGTDSP